MAKFQGLVSWMNFWNSLDDVPINHLHHTAIHLCCAQIYEMDIYSLKLPASGAGSWDQKKHKTTTVLVIWRVSASLEFVFLNLFQMLNHTAIFNFLLQSFDIKLAGDSKPVVFEALPHRLMVQIMKEDATKPHFRWFGTWRRILCSSPSCFMASCDVWISKPVICKTLKHNSWMPTLWCRVATGRFYNASEALFFWDVFGAGTNATKVQQMMFWLLPSVCQSFFGDWWLQLTGYNRKTSL